MNLSNRSISALCATIFAMVFTSCAPEPEAPPPLLVPAVQIFDESTLTSRAFPGRARAGQQVNLSFRVSGPLIELPVNVGDEIDQGDVVARIDPQDYITALGTATGQYDTAIANARRAAADFRRVQNVMNEDPGATSESALDLARASRDSTRATASSLENAVQTAKDNLGYTSLHAPFSGVIVETYVENFETVVAKQPILRLLDPSSIEFVINVPEQAIKYAPYVEEVSVVFDAHPDVEISATIKEIGKEASQATRTYPVTLVMSQPEGTEILAGMAGSATVAARLPEDDRAVGKELPATAVFAKEDPSKSYVWVVDESSQTISSREVDVGQLTSSGVLIRSGVEPGEWVIIKGVNSVVEGQVVRVLDYNAEDNRS